MIFEKQRILMKKYQSIESENGFYYPTDLIVDINTMQGQTLLKNMSWRFIEEVGEALEALFVFSHKEHFKEELIDGLHFLTELLILSGISETSFLHYFNDKLNQEFKESDHQKIFQDVAIIVQNIGTSMNCLKMKPWAKTHTLTDSIKYVEKLKSTYCSFLDFLFNVMTPEDILNYYFRKSNVNQFRQSSNY